MFKPQINRYYQHRYGGLYMVKDIATSTVDKSQWVVYVHCYPFEYQTWVRSYAEWSDGRFRLLEISEYQDIIKTDREVFQNQIIETRAASKAPREGDTSIVDGKVADFCNGKWMKVQG